MPVKIKNKKINLQSLVFLALLVAINIVLQKISFGPATLKVGLGFIGNIMLGYYFGPIWGGFGALISDLLSSAIFGVEGGFFPGFTLSAVLAVVIYGLFLYHQPVKLWRIAIATILVTIIVNILLNTYWLHLLYGINLKLAFLQRIAKELIVPWLQIAIGYIILQALQRVKINRYFK
ncbi:folate family ECF transporter S component [Lactobacillus sp. PV037]|uniref:folate family ECF transporter S component n=1 Tax=unclassified Lactobacillus TaxID=2620435 RepID=UPI00223F3DD5|nr:MULTISPECIES: folate family ECF transporter S component [unclassified Lactobacillus]QNQ81889.1 folate family ECF transporter S component [Lactobacillus sp. PV012]QNQ84073.1 folate family ECF transporter S component [Lactobacillus sp. PV037]